MYPSKKVFPKDYVPAKTADRLRRLAESATDEEDAEVRAREAVENEMKGDAFDE